MKNQKSARLHILAFAFASGLIGLGIAIWLSWSAGSTYMGSMMLRFGIPFWHGWGSLWMGLCFALTGGVLAGVYNAIADRLEND